MRTPVLAGGETSPAPFAPTRRYVQKVLKANPKWWMRDDSGKPIPFAGQAGVWQIDPSVPEARAFFANLSISLFHDRDEAVRLCDGVFVDGAGGPQHLPNVSDARFAAMVAGGQEMLAEMRQNLRSLNGGQVIGNPVLGYNSPEGSPAAYWNTTMGNTDGGFDEMFGSFLTMEGYPHGTSSAWDVERMRWSMESIINASSAGKTIVIHAFPGPAGALVNGGPMFPVRGNQSNPVPALRNDFRVAQWGGAERVPEDAEACRQASAARLVESLAPFLIVANENVFFGCESSCAWPRHVHAHLTPSLSDLAHWLADLAHWLAGLLQTVGFTTSRTVTSLAALI